MELRNMKYFITIAREGSITKAAQILHMTQPNLSRQVMMMEEELGAKLFIRTNKRSELTEDGRKLLQRFEEIISLVDKTEQEFLGEKGAVQGTISVGVIESAGLQMLGKQIQAFRQQYPNVTFDIVTAYGDDLKDKLSNGLLDFLIMTEPVDVANVDYLRLPFSDKWGMLLSRNHPFAGKDSIGIAELADIPAYYPRRDLLQQEIASWLGMSKKPYIIGTYAQLFGVIEVLKQDQEHSAAVCLEGAGQLFLQDNLRFIPLQPLKESQSIMMWKKERIFHPAARLFYKMISNAY